MKTMAILWLCGVGMMDAGTRSIVGFAAATSKGWIAPLIDACAACGLAELDDTFKF